LLVKLRPYARYANVQLKRKTPLQRVSGGGGGVEELTNNTSHTTLKAFTEDEVVGVAADVSTMYGLTLDTDSSVPMTDLSGKKLFLQKIENTSRDFMSHKFGSSGSGTEEDNHMYRYTNEAMKNDRRVSYDSDKYPWLVMAGV
jgi:hypothetical protein